VKRLALKILIVALISALAVGCGGPVAQEPEPQGEPGETGPDTIPGDEVLRPKTLIWGSASLGATGYIIIEALASTVNRNESSFRNSSISTQGSAENLVLISQKELHLAQTTSSDLYLAWNGLKPFEKEIRFSQILSYTYWPLPIAVLQNSPIKSVEELDGKKVCLGPAGGATPALMEEVFKEYGITVTPVYLSWQEGADALKLGHVDALVAIHTGDDTPALPLRELALTHPYRLLGFDPEKIMAASQRNPGITVGKVSKGAAEFYTEDLIAPAFSGVLAVDPNLDEEIVYKIVYALYENEEAVRKIGPELGLFSLDFALEMIIPEYPVHKGAAKYYKEKGVWKDDLVVSD